ncbi:MAG TPA: type II secretion system protein GspG, partial [Methylomirabilota bacterium]|nr:type II secretion system protein GspG [Methylomirabilota bacterium]
IVIINPVQQLKKARDAQRKSDLRQIQAALELYRADNAAYPAALPACGGIWKVGTSTYIQKVPCDPKNTGQYTYRYVVTVGTTYTLTSCLENVSDIQKDTSNNATYCSGGTTNWSYTLNNP